MLGGKQKPLLSETFIFFTVSLFKKTKQKTTYKFSAALKAAHIRVCPLLECLSALPEEHVPSSSPHGEWQNLPYGGHLVQVHK